MHKYVFVFGGVISGVGKGVVTASIAAMLQKRGLKVTVVKIDPYINIDAGTMRPTEHGEVWVTEDGGEIDQDFGHYERFLNINLLKANNITTGQVYKKIIEDERAGKYLGKTVQFIPHVLDQIIERIEKSAKGFDVCLVESGGVVGDYENIPFMFAFRRLALKKPEDSCSVLVVYLPTPNHLGEMKTKPAQHAIKSVRELGINPDFIICRSEQAVDELRKQKIADYSNILPENIISSPNVKNIYSIPLLFEKQDLGKKVTEKLGLKTCEPDWSDWQALLNKKLSKKLVIGLVSKYYKTGDFELPDSYVSIIQALKHSANHLGVNLELIWISGEKIEENPEKLKELNEADGVVVLPGFGGKGVEGKIKAIQWLRENNKPFLGICYGMQLAVVEFARNVCGLSEAHSTELSPDTKNPVINTLPEQGEILKKCAYGATMRLGSHPARLDKNSLIHSFYDSETVWERHRHRYEVNPEYVEKLDGKGLWFSGKSPDGKLVEFMELRNHPCFVGTQAHPEYKSRFTQPSPFYTGFLKKCLEMKD